MNSEKNNIYGNFDEFEKSIDEEIKKADAKRVAELLKIENEVSNIKALLATQEGILQDKIDIFYLERIKDLEKLRNDSIVLKNLPNLDKTEIGSIVAESYNKIRKGSWKLLHEKTYGDLEFIKSTNDCEDLIGSVKPTNEIKNIYSFNFSSELITGVSKFELIICSERKVMVFIKKTSFKPTHEWVNLENGERQYFDRDKFYFDIQSAALTFDSYSLSDDQFFITQTGELYKDADAIGLFASYIIARPDYVFWLSKDEEIFGPSINDGKPLKENDYPPEELCNFIKTSLKSNIELLFGNKKIFLVDTSKNYVQVISQRLFVGSTERIIGSRKINKNTISLIFQNTQDPPVDLVIRHYEIQ